MVPMWNRQAVVAVLRRPGLWPEALRAAGAMARRGWWRRPPFLPVPDRAYLSWRAATAYGTAAAPIAPGDLVAYLRWRRRQRRSVR
jgi:hypothetical protein